MPTLDILAVTDLHFVGAAAHACPHPGRRADLALTLLRKAWLRLRHLGVRPDLVVVLGDVTDNGAAANAERDFEAVAVALRAFGVPYLAVHGNHDGEPAVFERAFGTRPGLHTVNGVGFLVFNDTVGAGDVTTRESGALALAGDAARANPGMPLVALQHNPLHPAIVGDYPYMLTNGEAVLESYARAGVVAALSGHSHAGQEPRVRDGVTYCTVPALCEAPFSFAHVRVEGRDVTVRPHALRLDAGAVTDVHCHTEYAYCGTSVSAARCLAVSQALSPIRTSSGNASGGASASRWAAMPMTSSRRANSRHISTFWSGRA